MMTAQHVARILRETNRLDLALARNLSKKGGETMKTKAKTGHTRPAKMAAKKERAARKPAAPKERPAKSVSYVTPGRGYVTAVIFGHSDRDKEVIGWAKGAMEKAGKDKGSVNVTEAMNLTGEVSGLLVLARYTTEGAKAQIALRRAIRDAAKETLREAGYIVRR